MISGFNTDIKFNGVTYHVQTEDKGLKTPLILSLVYQGGTILASKRSPYDDLLSGSFDEKILEERLNRQHKLICAAIRAGRIEELKGMTLNQSSKKGVVVTNEVVTETQPKIAEKAVKEVIKISPIELKPKDGLPENISDRQTESGFDKSNFIEEPETKIPKPTDEPVWDIPVVEDVVIIEEEFSDPSQIIGEDDLILPPEAIEIVGDLEQFGALIEDELKVKILGDNKFKSGDRKNINILVCRGSEEKIVNDASVMVKVVGSDFRPLIYHTKADSNGVASVFLKLPGFRSGRAAVLIRAMVGSEETELRRVITPE